jgi:hypothetical protein
MANGKDTQLGGGITQAQFDEWKNKYGSIHKIKVVVVPDVTAINSDTKEVTIVTPGDTAIGYIRDINDDLDLMSNVLSIQSGNKVLEAKIYLLDNAWLGGDDRMIKVTKIKIPAATQAAKTVDILDGSVEKL